MQGCQVISLSQTSDTKGKEKLGKVWGKWPTPFVVIKWKLDWFQHTIIKWANQNDSVGEIYWISIYVNFEREKYQKGDFNAEKNSVNLFIILLAFVLKLAQSCSFNPKAYPSCILFRERRHVKTTNRISSVFQSWMPQVFNKTYRKQFGFWVGFALYHDQPLDGEIQHEMEAAATV